jgi:hypothetical protein
MAPREWEPSRPGMQGIEDWLPLYAASPEFKAGRYFLGWLAMIWSLILL